MKVLGTRYVNGAASVRLKPSKKQIRILDPTLPFQNNDTAVKTYVHPISS
jgi:hypothetical protein